MKFKKIGVFIALLLTSGMAFLQTSKPANFEAGEKVYGQSCLTCHMQDGSGVPGLNPPLKNTEWVTGDKSRLIRVILLGLNETIEIDGEEYANPMPAQPQLTDREIADALTYVRYQFGNKSSAVSMEEVKKERKKIGK